MENKVGSDYVRFVRQFEDAEDSTREAREKCERDRDYRDGKQLTEAEEKTLKKRGQPIVVFNEIQPKVNTMLGLEKQTRKDPKALPRTPNDEQAAHAATDAIRYVCEDCNWDDKRSQAAENLVVEGTCAIMVGVKRARVTKSALLGSTAMTGNTLDPDIRRIAWDRFYYDPASSEQDFSDAVFMGTVIWMDLDDALRKYPEAKSVLEGTWLEAKSDNTFGDKPKGNRWADYKRRRVRLIEHYYNEGGWKFCIVTGGGFVIEPMDSPYLDESGEPECPIKAVSLYVDRDNNRYGEVRMMISPQDEVNKRRSKALHLITMRQVRVSPAAALDAKKVKDELAQPDGVFVAEAGDFEVLQTNDQAVGNLNLLQDAREHIHRTGANNALAGRDTAGQSGRAIIAQQQGGITESAGYLDAVRMLSIAVYRSVWARVRQHWTAERWVRVTDDQRNIQFVGLNTPVLDEYGQLAAVENNVAELDVDIIVDEGVDTPTIAAEQFSELVQLAQSGIPIPPAVLIEASSLRNKDQLLQMLEQAQQQDPMAEQMKQVQMAGAVAEVEETQSKAALNVASAQQKQASIMNDAYRAGAAA